MTANILTAERLRALLHSNPGSGVFTRLVAPNNRVRVGDSAGTPVGNGYVRICIDGKQYYSHRLAWLYVKGIWPSDQIDHINGQREDNRIENLREASQCENMQNLRKARSDSKSGFLGVHWVAQKSKWQAKLKLAGKSHHIGFFNAPALAHEAYLKAKRKLHPMGML